jgi:hypothetical protein
MTRDSNRPIAIHREGVRRTLLIAVLGWACFFFVAALVGTGLSDEQKRQVAQDQALYEAMARYTLTLAVGGLVAGGSLVLLAALVAARRTDLNEHLPDNPFTRGQLVLWVLLSVTGIVAGVGLMVGLAPLAAPELLPLRDEQGRALIGGVAGLLGGNLIHGFLFRFCRL